MKKYDFACVIGRFQITHNGHMALFKKAKELADKVIIVVGSHNCPISIKNPFDTANREFMLWRAVKEIGLTEKNCIITHISDSAYNYHAWQTELRYKLSEYTELKKVCLVGMYKDDSSYYLNGFPEWILEAEKNTISLNSTDLREMIYTGRLEEMRGLVPQIVFDFIKNAYDDGYFKDIILDHKFIKKYKKTWETAPFPPIFVTADAVVFYNGYVLVVKRGINPGKGKYALPGGFIKQDESVFGGCIRELYEETEIDIGKSILELTNKDSHVFDHPKRDPRGRVITHAFMFDLNGRTEFPKIRGSDDASEALWFPVHCINEEEPNFFNDHCQIIKYFMNRQK